MNFSDIFYYDTTSPTCLRWNVNIYSGRDYSHLRIGIGDVAGSRHVKCYKVIYQKKSYSVHRVIWQMFNGELKRDEQIDHINQNPWDNRLENLRVVSNAINKRNSGMYSNNSTGVTGVRWITMDGNLYACATWNSIDFKRKTAYYSVSRLGLLPAFKLAFIRRQQEIENLNKQGAMYTELHGKIINKATQSL